MLQRILQSVEKQCIFSNKSSPFDIWVLAIWFVTVLVLIIGGYIIPSALSYISWVFYGLAVLTTIVFIAWIPREYKIFDDHLHIKCNFMKKNFPFENIVSIERNLPLTTLISGAIMEKSVYMTSFGNSIHIKLSGVLAKSTQVSPMESDAFFETLQKALSKYKKRTGE